MTNAFFLVKALSVICTASDGYRRAGFVLKRGENILDGESITAEKYQMLNDDPRLTVSVIGDDENSIDMDNDAHLDGGNQTTQVGNKLDGDGTSGTGTGTGANHQNTPQDPPSNESALKLSQTALAALAETDPLIYFNQDGSPRIAKWREATGNEALSKEAVIAAIELTKTAQE